MYIGIKISNTQLQMPFHFPVNQSVDKQITDETSMQIFSAEKISPELEVQNYDFRNVSCLRNVSFDLATIHKIAAEKKSLQ